MSGPTLLDALRACVLVFPGGVLNVVGKTDRGSPVSVPLWDGATREAIAALEALEARPLLEPHALEIAIRERDDARAHVERLAHEVSVNRDTIAMSLEDCRAARNATSRAEAAYAAEKQAHGDTHRLLTEASAEVERARTAATEAIHARMAAEAIVKALEGDAVPFEWGIFSPAPDDRLQESFVTKDEAEADLEYYPRGFLVSPLYRHPPRPAGKPVVWAIVFSDGMVNCYATEFDARQSQSFGRGRLTPLYEAPPPAAGVDVAAIRKALKALRAVRIWSFEDARIGSDALDAIAAAIGEKAAPPSGCVDHGPDGVGC